MSRVPPPLISIITVTRNNRQGLARTLASVRGQTFRDFEHVVIDGASSDGTLALLEDHAAELGRFVSEPDGGIADAFNKGLAMARGQWLNFLNAGDTWVDDSALARAVPHFWKASIISGHSITDGVISPPYPVSNTEPFPRRAWLSHQASFFHRRVFETCGGFDTRFRVRMDYELWLRALPRFPHAFIEEELVDFEAGGVSSTQPTRFWGEELAANRMHLRHAALVNARAVTRLLLHRALHRLGWFDAYRRWRLHMPGRA